MSHVAKFILNIYQMKYYTIDRSVDVSSETVKISVMLAKITDAECYLFSYSIL